jgi:mRNA interferase MazF
LALLCPITGQAKGYPFEVAVPEGLSVTGVVLADQIKSLDWRVRKASLICSLPAAVVERVIEKVNALLASGPAPKTSTG